MIVDVEMSTGKLVDDSIKYSCIDLPPEATSFIQNFDYCNTVEPFSFVVEHEL